MSEPNESALPVAQAERISSVDILRGFALLGILLMNIQNFGLPGAAYDNPLAWGGATGANLYYWIANQIFFEGKMRFLFSMLFGAGAILLTERAIQRGAGIEAAELYQRRCLWLMLFGLLHGYLIWEGDILFFYGAVGLGLLAFRNMSVKSLLIAAGVVFFIAQAGSFVPYFDAQNRRSEGQAAQKLKEQKKPLNKEQEAALKSYEETLEREDPVKRKAKIEAEIKKMRGNWATVFKERAGHTFNSQTTFFYKFGLTDILFAMLLGMAFYKAGVLSAEKSAGFYAKLALAGYGLGLPVLTYMTFFVVGTNWDVLQRDILITVYEYGRLTIGLGHLSLLLFFLKLGWFRPLTYLLACVGQMALTNYLLTSILATLLFNGYGLGKFGALERHQLLYVVFTIWAINLIISPLWLRYFRFGPAEWVWRSLTYWKKQPMRLASPELLRLEASQ